MRSQRYRHRWLVQGQGNRVLKKREHNGYGFRLALSACSLRATARMDLATVGYFVRCRTGKLDENRRPVPPELGNIKCTLYANVK